MRIQHTSLSLSLSLFLLSILTVATALPSYEDLHSLNARAMGLMDRDTPPKLCNTSQIHLMDVGGCECREKLKESKTCPPRDCTDCSLKPTVKDVHSCHDDCDDRQADCIGCGIYFHSLCDCLQSPKCRTTGDVKPGAPAVWALLETKADEDDLITSTRLIRGIIDMGKDVPFADEGWVFAQDPYAYKPKVKALALNSFRARTHSQVHIHVCNSSDTLYKQLSDEPLTNKNSNSFVRLKEDPDLYCLMVPNGGVISKWSQLIEDFLKNSAYCPEQVGAGILEDHRNVTWGCVTTNTAGPIGKFCNTTKPH